MSGGAGWESSDGRLAPGAEWYAGAAGWKVFPCWGIAGGRCACGGSHREAKDWGKHPHSRLVGAGGDDGGYKAATNDVETVRAWWTADPEANVALACRPSGILVLDADPRHGGDASLEILEKEIGGLPATVEAVTGEYTLKGRVVRGRHVLLKVDPSLELVGKLKELPGIDIKWNGYVLIAPSRHGSGIVYQWAAGRAPWEHAIADAPEELMQLLVRKGSGGGAGVGSGGFGSLDWNGEKLDVDAILEAGIPDGERMVTLYKLACAFANQYPVNTEHGRASVMRVMFEINSQRVFPPMGWGDGTEDDVKPHVERAIEFVRSNPKTSGAPLPPDLLQWATTQQASGGGGSTEPAVKPSVDASSSPERVVTAPGGVEAPDSWDAIGATAGDGEPLPDVLVPMPGGGTGGMGDDELPPVLDDNPGNDGNGATVRRSFSDKGNAARLIDYYSRVVKYSPGMGWVVWEPGVSERDGSPAYNGRWTAGDSDDIAFNKALDLDRIVYREMVRECGGDPAHVLWDTYSSWAGRCEKVPMMSAAVRLWRVEQRWTRVEPKRWDRNPTLLGVRNGVIDLKTGERIRATPDMMITKHVDVAYTSGQRNPKWEQFLDFATGGDKELQDWLQRAVGYTLTGLRSYDVLFLIHGFPGSGKSTFLEAIGRLMGDYFVEIPAPVILDTKGMGGSGSDEYYWAQLLGKRMALLSELPESQPIKEDALKRLTGDTTLTGRHPKERPFHFESQAKIWMGTNHLPIISDSAMWRRIRAIPFNAVPEKPDPELKGYLSDPEAGLPGVLAWAVEGAVKLLSSPHKDALGTCAAVHASSETYRQMEDRMGTFLDDQTELVPGSVVALGDVFDRYELWCNARGERPRSFIGFAKMLRERNEQVEPVGAAKRTSTLLGRKLVGGQVAGTEDWATITAIKSWRR